MNRRFRLSVALAALAFLAPPACAWAAPAAPVNLIPARLATRGTTTTPPAGAGRVVVQVLVNANGSHKATRVIRTSNAGDNKAAMEIAQSSTYHPATRNGKPIVWFYDYTLVFTGSSVSTSDLGPPNSQLGQIGRMVRAGNYAGAKAMATTYLASNPGNTQARTQLGVAEYFAGDYTDSAQAFSQVGTVSARYKQLAAHAFASAAVALSTSNPATAVSYGKKAVQLDGGANSLFALGVAELGAKDAASAVVNLKKARSLGFAQKTTDLKSKVNLDTALLEAYSQQGDSAGVQAIAAEIKQLDPTSPVPGRILGNQYLAAAFASLQALKYDDAVKNFDLAAQAGDSQVQVTAYAQASLALAEEQKPDYDKVKAYADKALAVKSDDALANFAEGVALAGQWSISKSANKADLKKQAIATCNKAEQYATAEGNNALLLKIQAFVKASLS
ncbi:MAG TPA: energy transducer TonB [Candidatus Baltobacteraceae bacterium]